jgi:murein DD-endopeptidase MepM/ murein hydrolase activator NlpD
MRKVNRVGIHGILVLGLAVSAVSCGTNEAAPAPASEERSSASTQNGTWLYYPLDSLNNPGYAGYCGYGCGKTHKAYDFRGNIGDRVLAAAAGTVVQRIINFPNGCPASNPNNCAYDNHSCGNWMLIDHGSNRFTKYCHMDTITSKVGDRVGVGTPIGTVGWTAANYIVHLHFAVSNSSNYTNGCQLGDPAGNCVDPGIPPGTTTNDTCNPPCAAPSNNLWVQVGGTVVLASCVPNTSNADICAQNSRLGNTACGPFYLNKCGTVVDCGTCGPGFACTRGICTPGTPTCPSGVCGYRSGWCGVGAYCGSSGVLNGAPNTLYQCNSPSGSAAVINSCGGYQCIFRPGLDDVCAFGPTTCPVNGNGWYGAGLYCGRAQGMGYAEPYVVYYCGCAGCKASVNQTCGSNCVVAANGYNDHC